MLEVLRPGKAEPRGRTFVLIGILGTMVGSPGCGSSGESPYALPNEAGPTESGPDAPRDSADSADSPEAGPDAAVDAPEAGPGECVPKTCEDLGADCGSAPDGCGGKVECGPCPDGQACGGGGTNVCGTDACTPKSCVQLDAQCGWASDGCSLALDCGGCAPPEVCGKGGDLNSCGCSPKTCAQLGANCGSMPDGCLGTLDCGDCNGGQVCGGGGPNLCGSGECVSKSCSQLGASCGYTSDGCSQAIYCGDCVEPDTCGGGGIANQCGCIAKSCSQMAASCGTVYNGCAEVNCGTCTPPDTCGGAGVDNQCGCTCSLPHATTECLAGVCSIRQCDPGWGDCNNDPDDGCEVDLDTDPEHCGGCASACSVPNGTPGCSDGSCVIASCKSGWADCDTSPGNGCETHVSTDPANCGACGKKCATPPNTTDVGCTAGDCSISACSSTYHDQNASFSDGCECKTDGVADSCASAKVLPNYTTDVVVRPSATTFYNIVPTGDRDWFAGTFTVYTNCTSRPRIELVDSSGSLRMKVYNASSCSSTTGYACSASEGGNSTKGVRTWDFGHSTTCGNNASIDATPATGSYFKESTSFRIEVYATASSTTCLPYQLRFSRY